MLWIVGFKKYPTVCMCGIENQVDGCACAGVQNWQGGKQM